MRHATWFGPLEKEHLSDTTLVRPTRSDCIHMEIHKEDPTPDGLMSTGTLSKLYRKLRSRSDRHNCCDLQSQMKSMQKRKRK